MREVKYVIRKVKVNRSLTPQQMLDATGRKQCILPEFDNDHVLETMPRQGEEEVEVFFFRAGRNISAQDLALKLKKHGLEADPYAQLAVNIDDSSFADEHPNAVRQVSQLLEQSKLEPCPAFKFRRGHMPFRYEFWYEDGFTITDDMAPWVAPQYRNVEPGWSGWDIPGRTRKRILCTACKKIIVEMDERR